MTWALLWIFSSGCTGCGDAELDHLATQRNLGRAVWQQSGIIAELIPGVVRAQSVDTSQATMRASAGVARLTVRMNADAQGQLALTLENLHPQAQLSLIGVTYLSSLSDLDARGCPEQPPAPLTCTTQPDAAGCQRDVTLTPDAALHTRSTFTLTATPCQSLTFDLQLPEAARREPLELLVVGATHDPLRAARIIHAREDALDMAIVLGDFSGSRADGARALYRALADAPIPVIVLPGRQELELDQRRDMEAYFGPFDLRLTLKDVQLLAFHTAHEQLGARGLSNLQSQLAAMALEDQRAQGLSDGAPRRWPALAMSHLPLFDPSGLHEQGLQSRIEGARAMSLLAEHGVDTLLAGGRGAPDDVDSVPRVWVTSARDEVDAEVLRLRLSLDPSPDARQVGERYLSLWREAL